MLVQFDKHTWFQENHHCICNPNQEFKLEQFTFYKQRKKQYQTLTKIRIDS